MRLWKFSSSVNSFFKCASTAKQWDKMSDFWPDPSSMSILYMCANSKGSGETAQKGIFCQYSLEMLHQGDFNKYPQHIHDFMQKVRKITLKLASNTRLICLSVVWNHCRQAVLASTQKQCFYIDLFFIFEPWHDKTNKVVQERLRSVWVSAQSDQSLCCPHEESLGP